jgi:DNA-binding response OmpR family regulator
MAPLADAAYRFGSIEVYFRRAEVRRDGILLGLSAKEYKLLCYFIHHRGATLSREELLERVWRYPSAPTTRTIDTHVAWLRGKLEPNRHRPEFIVTVRGLGYKFIG